MSTISDIVLYLCILFYFRDQNKFTPRLVKNIADLKRKVEKQKDRNNNYLELLNQVMYSFFKLVYIYSYITVVINTNIR